MAKPKADYHGSRRHALAMRKYVVYIKENCEAILLVSSLQSDDLGPACSECAACTMIAHSDLADSFSTKIYFMKIQL